MPLRNSNDNASRIISDSTAVTSDDGDEAEIDRIANTPCPLAQREQRIAKLEEEIDRLQRTEVLSSLRVRHARLDARHGSCWVLSPHSPDNALSFGAACAIQI